MIAENTTLGANPQVGAFEHGFQYKNFTLNNTASSKHNSMKLFGNDNFNFNYPFSYQNFDLQGYVVRNPGDSFLIKVKGDSMIGAGINNGDVLLVDRSAKAVEGSIVIAEVNGKLVVKRLQYGYNQFALISENKKYAPIFVNKDDDFHIWGVVQSVIKTM